MATAKAALLACIGSFYVQVTGQLGHASGPWLVKSTIPVMGIERV